MARLRRKSFFGDTRGATAVEFALLAPIFFTLLGAILETSVNYLAAQVLESGVQDTSRLIRTGEAQRRNWTVADYKKDVCGRLFGLFGDCSDMYVSVRQIDTFQSADYEVPLDRDCKSNCKWSKSDEWQPGVASGVVMIQVYYRYPSILQTPLADNRLGDGRLLMGAATVFRNEPF
ncbi:hypothetical protein ASG47_03615 [Devosia sp. Leaf420]|uniref:TadE/TadG family type IV pilus assembly protein n=1 Tax=Devosia sp. Leaf420 TaxID=1736374 RepID=UPI0007146797|nr:TadE/TadG family type IV pilus assembly protein [Devosia sp. Leaf420]KQT49431.1 hypothetical protein ASG47_03615 [Devosia sp. Leaf420]